MTEQGGGKEQRVLADGSGEEPEEQDVDTSSNSGNGDSESESFVDRTIRSLFSGRKPTERFGFGLASETASDAVEEVREEGAPDEVSWDQLDQHLDDVERATEEYNDFRMEGEEFLQNVRNEVNSMNAENAADTAALYQRVAQEAENLDVHEYEFAPNSGEHEFEDQFDDPVGLLDFADQLNGQINGYEGRAQQRKSDLKELEEEEQKLEAQREELEEERKERNRRAAQQREDEETRYLTDDDDVSDFERRATEGRIKEQLEEVDEELSDIFEQAEEASEKKQLYEDEAMARQDAVEDAYNSRVSEVRDFFPDALENFTQVVDRLDRVAGKEIPALEEVNAEYEERSGKLSEDGRNQVVEAYSEAVTSFARTAADQYAQLENAVSELEAVEDVMAHEYFDDIKQSEGLREDLEEVYDTEEFEEYVSERLEESGVDYSGRDDIREIFNGLEADHTEKLA